MRTLFIVASLALCMPQGIFALSRANNSSNAGESESADAVLDAVMAVVSKTHPKASVAPKLSNASSVSHRAKLDIGLTDYEHNLTQALVATVRNITPSPSWTEQMRQRLIVNVSGNISATLNARLKPLKQSVGKTWMVLPEDIQKDAYVAQIRSSFGPVLTDSLSTATRKFEIAGRRVQAYNSQRVPLSPDDLLARSEDELASSITSERCYGDALAQIAEEDPSVVKNSQSNATSPKMKSKFKRFCMASVVSKFVSRLNDSQNLISMTMRFEAQALDFAQTN